MNKVQDCFNKYIDYCEYITGLRPETIKGYKEVFKNFQRLMPEIESVDQITSSSLVEFFKKLNTRVRIVGRNTECVGVKDSTLKTYNSRLHRFCEWLVKENYIKNNPVGKRGVPDPEYIDSKIIKDEDFLKIISAIRLRSDNSFIMRRDLMMVYILRFCGLRRSELRLLDISDIDLQKRMLTVRAETSKSKKCRSVPINKIAISFIEDFFLELKKSGRRGVCLIAPSVNDSRLSPDGLKHWVKKIRLISGVRFHLHQFRHSFACHLMNNDTSAIKIQKLLGHADLRMTQIYTRSSSNEDFIGDVDALEIKGL